MTEGIASRVARLVAGSVNMLIDTVENAAPEVVMEQAVREIDGAIEDVRSELGRTLANRHVASSRLMEENGRHEDLANKIALAIKEGRDDLAETAISQQLDVEAQIPVLEAAIADAGAKERELEGYIEALNAKKREMEEEIREFKSRQDAPTGGAGDGSAPPPGRSVEDKVRKAEGAYDRVMRDATNLPGRAGTPDARTAAQVAELEDLARTNRIKERLAAAKAAAKGA